MNYLFKDDKRKSITLALLTLTVLFLGLYETNNTVVNNLPYMAGAFTASLIWGLIIGLIYIYLISKQQRSIWQKLKIIMFITFLAACINSIPRIVSSFILGYISAK